MSFEVSTIKKYFSKSLPLESIDQANETNFIAQTLFVYVEIFEKFISESCSIRIYFSLIQ